MSDNHNVLTNYGLVRVTIFKFSEFNPICLQTTICSVEYQDYAQYRNIPHIYHVKRETKTLCVEDYRL